MRDLIRHILKENRLKQELKQVIKDNDIFDAAEMVGGLNNLKSIFKDEPEFSEILDELTGVVDFSYYEKYSDKNPILFPFKYEIVGIKKNRWNTNSWPELNLIYDEDKLSPSENETLKSIIAVIQNDNTTGKIKTKTLNFKDSNYFDITQINGKDVDLHEDEYSFSNEYVKRIYNKLYGESESLNESINKSDEKRNKVIEKIMDNIIFPEYKHIICGYYVKNDEVFNEPVVNVTFIGGYGTKLWPVTQGIQKMYRDILDEIWDTIYDYINIPVGVTMETTPKCDEQENIYLRESENKSEDKKLKLLTKMIHEFFDDVSFIDIKKYENKPMIRVYFESYNDEYAGNEEIYFAEQIQDKIYEYTGIKLVPYWHTIQYNTDADFRLDAIKLKYDNEGNVINESESLNESDNRETDKKLKLVKEMIYSLFDEVEFIEVDTNYEGKPLIKIYHDVDDTAANYDNWFTHRIIDEIKEMTGDGIILSPWWAARWDWKYKNADFYIDVEKLKYDNLGNVINESEDDKEKKIQKNLKAIRHLLDTIDVDGLCEMWVEYNPEDGDYEIRSKTTRKYLDMSDMVRELGYIDDTIRSWKLKTYVYAPWYVENCEDEVEFLNESENKQERKFNKLIQNVEDYLNSNEYPSVKKFTVYYEDTHDDVIVNIFFNVQDSIRLGGGINSVIKRVGKQVMEDLEVFPMDFKYYIHFDRDINESEEKKPKYLNIIKDLVEPFEDEDCVCDIRVLYNEEDDMYLIDLNMGTEELNEKFFAVVGMTHYVKTLRVKIKETIKDYLPIDNFYVGSYASPNCKWKTLNESSIKEKSLVKLIEKDGLYDFIEMTGLDFNQVRSLLKQIDNPKEILKQYIREFVLEKGGVSGENYGSIFNVQIPLSNTKYVEDILVHDADSIAIEMWEYHLDEYGHREQKDQYLTTINNLTNDELLSIISWMMETIQNGYRD
jgi:hypothetical protein